MKKLGFLALVMVMALGVGCAQKKPLTPEEIAAERERQIAATTRIYEGKTPEEVLLAAATVFRLADDDYTVSHSQNSIQAKRGWYHFFTLALSSGTDDWIVTATEEANGTKVVTQCVHEMIQMRVGPQTVTNEGLYNLFYQRLEYLMGINQEWLTCKEAKKKYPNGFTEVKYFFDPLCTVATDRTPDGKSAVERQKEQENKL